MKKAIKIIIPIIVAIILLRLCGHFIITNQDKLGFYDIPESTTIDDMQNIIKNTIDSKYINDKNYVSLSKILSNSDLIDECYYKIYNDDFNDENICIQTTKNTIKNLYNTPYYNDCIKHIKFVYCAADETLLYIITLKNFANFNNDFDNIQDYLQIHNAHIMINGHY